MNNLAGATGNAAASAAVERVLEAEREASEAVASCEREARAIVDEARQGALRIAERATERIAAARKGVARRVADAVGRCEAEAAALPEITQVAPANERCVAQAVAAIAAELTGAAP